jgi:hypothetical protein
VAQPCRSSRATVVQEEPRHAAEERHASRPGAFFGARGDLDGGLREHACREDVAILLVYENGEERLALAVEDFAPGVDDFVTEGRPEPRVEGHARVWHR